MLATRLGVLIVNTSIALLEFGSSPAATIPARGLCTANRANGACQTQISARLLTVQPADVDTERYHVHGATVASGKPSSTA